MRALDERDEARENSRDEPLFALFSIIGCLLFGCGAS
jgi:hypothetical protein